MSPLMRLSTGEKQLAPAISISENIAEGVTEDFQETGFTRPSNTPLIEQGKLVGTLCSPRTAIEYGLENNGASGDESPCALDMAPGEMPESEALERLGTGIYVSNLWYLNFSDRSAGRITGMTRFATLWIENGQAIAPVAPMRFDESIYRALGENLIALTIEREFDLSTSTYSQRSTNSSRVPGALIDSFTFTL
jgi:predicted Zn-dependent protease